MRQKPQVDRPVDYALNREGLIAKPTIAVDQSFPGGLKALNDLAIVQKRELPFVLDHHIDDDTFEKVKVASDFCFPGGSHLKLLGVRRTG